MDAYRRVPLSQDPERRAKFYEEYRAKQLRDLRVAWQSSPEEVRALFMAEVGLADARDEPQKTS